MDNFEHDLQSSGHYPPDPIQRLKQADIRSYHDLYNLIRDENADPDLRRIDCSVLGSVGSRWRKSSVDRRRALSPLLVALKSPDSGLRSYAALAAGRLGNKRVVPVLLDIVLHDTSGVRSDAIQALGSLGDKRAIPALMTIAQDKNAEQSERIYAVISLTEIDDQSVIPGLRAIMFDQTDDLEIRSVAAENLSQMLLVGEDLIPDYIALLNDKAVEMRFWAAFGLITKSGRMDIYDALPTIDRIVAYDTEVLPGWWPVCREAVPALENIWYQRYTVCTSKEDCCCCGAGTYLISPLLEYWDCLLKSRTNEPPYSQPFEQYTDLKIDPGWLANQITAHWPDAQINIRQSDALILDWLIEMKHGKLLGGLHRDEFCIFLTGDEDDVATFALWYRQIIAPQFTLRLYEWADPGREIRIEMTPAELVAALHDYGV
jgi:hypothetical protein